MLRASIYAAEEERLARYLKRLGQALFALGLLAFLTAVLAPGVGPFKAAPFLVTNTTAGLILLGLLAWYAKADVRRQWPLINVLLAGLLIGALGSLALYFSPLGGEPVLLVSAAVFAAGAVPLYLLLSAVRGELARSAPATWQPWIPDRALTGWEKAARVIFGVYGLGAVVAAIATLVSAFLSPDYARDNFVSPLMMAGSSIKIGVLGILGLLVAKDVRRYVHTVQTITLQIVGNGVSLLIIIILALLGYGRFGVLSMQAGGTELPVGLVMLGAGLVDVVGVGGFILLNRQINRLFAGDLLFLDLYRFRALEAIAETLITGGEAEVLRPYQVALRTDQYLRSFNSGRLRLANWAITGMQLWPLLYFQPPVTFLNPHARQVFIDQHFKEEIVQGAWGYRLLDGIVRAVTVLFLLVRGRPAAEAKGALTFTGLVEAMLRFNMQLAYMGYYSNEATWSRAENNGRGLGYVPFSKRPKPFEVTPLRHHPPLVVTTPAEVERRGLDTINDPDVVIIGSGAAGSILAEQMLARGRRVLLLEKGRHTDPKDFTEDEVHMLGRLYSDGALQIAQSLRFTILQGSCVGGTTVVNNAVCFDTPDAVVEAWNQHGQVLHPETYRAAQAEVRRRMKIGRVTSQTRQPLEGGVLNHGDAVIAAGIERYFQRHPQEHHYDVVEANITDCLGCGYCNIGCPYGRKLSMLDEVLPAAQARYGAENFQIFSEAQAVRLVEDGGKITRVEVQVGGKRTLRLLNPKTVIVSGGTIHSSWLLMQSGIGRGKLPVGRGLSFNMGSPLHALFPQELNSYDGLQIAHYLRLQNQPGFIFETWFNPPVAQAMAMPGWLETHFHNMHNYNRMAAVGILVGTESSGFVTPALLTGGPDVVYTPSERDLDKLVQALVTFGEIFFDAGAEEVFASTRSYRAYQNGRAISYNRSDLSKLRELVKDDRDILLGTGHPQGGNALAASPEHGVVGPDFKVFGYQNLYVADASIFPSATTVNPQLTVMTLAHYAAQLVDC